MLPETQHDNTGFTMLEVTAEIPKVKPKRDWRMPNWFAQARLLAGSDWRAGALLYRIN